MADPPTYSRTGDDSYERLDGGSTPGMPRWLKVSAIIVALLALLVVVLMLFGADGSGDAHGPDRHSLGGDTPSVSLAEGQVSSAGNLR